MRPSTPQTSAGRAVVVRVCLSREGGPGLFSATVLKHCPDKSWVGMGWCVLNLNHSPQLREVGAGAEVDTSEE